MSTTEDDLNDKSKSTCILHGARYDVSRFTFAVP